MTMAGRATLDPQRWIVPAWPMPPGVFACTTTRLGPGISAAPFEHFNLGSRCGDTAAAVSANRAALVNALGLPATPAWLHQVHGTHVVEFNAGLSLAEIEADVAITHQSGCVLAVLTADCLPILIAAADGSEIAAIHAGWRGLGAGVIDACVQRLHTPREDLLVWLGPAIGPRVYEVGAEVRQSFVGRDSQAASAFAPSGTGHWLCDLYALARQCLRQLNIAHIYGGNLCTYSDSQRFYSHRRDQVTGRMASLIWLD